MMPAQFSLTSLASVMCLLLFMAEDAAADWNWESQKISLTGLELSADVTPFPQQNYSYSAIDSHSLIRPERPEGSAEELRQIQHQFADPGLVLEELPSTPAFWVPAETVQTTASGWQILPDGLLYHSYLAGEKEPRFASQWLQDRKRGMVWEAVVGGRWGLVRNGSEGPDAEGFQFDVVGAAFARIDPEEESDLEAADFNAGFIGTWRYGRWRYKLGYNHYSCHLGDEFLLKNTGYPRANYVRDSILAGAMYDVTPAFQLYAEVYNALGTGGGAEPWEFQFGAQYAPAQETGLRGAPFFAINGHLREEFNYGGSVNVQAGWAWRGGKSDRLFRFGVQHYNGPSMQWSFVDRYENMTGMGIWFDY